MSTRIPDYPINPLFINRWSPRAMSGEDLTDKELMTLFEAARWAPSSYNNQPWRFIYAKRNTHFWKPFLELLAPSNQTWAQHAAVLLIIASHKTFSWNDKPSRTHSFDTGAAWENLALQASLQSIVAHGMEGFDYQKAQEQIQLPQEYTVEAMIALGKPGNKKDLPEELQKREEPSDRNKLATWTFEGVFTEQA